MTKANSPDRQFNNEILRSEQPVFVIYYKQETLTLQAGVQTSRSLRASVGFAFFKTGSVTVTDTKTGIVTGLPYLTQHGKKFNPILKLKLHITAT
jgi:hypothetical protein